jgi:hypothetical protein
MKQDQFGSLMNQFGAEAEALVAERERLARREALKARIRKILLLLVACAGLGAGYFYRSELIHAAQSAGLTIPGVPNPKAEDGEATGDSAHAPKTGPLAAKAKLTKEVAAIKAEAEKRDRIVEEVGK